MVSKLFNFDDWAAKNRLRSQSVSKSVSQKKVHRILCTPLAIFFCHIFFNKRTRTRYTQKECCFWVPCLGVLCLDVLIWSIHSLSLADQCLLTVSHIIIGTDNGSSFYISKFSLTASVCADQYGMTPCSWTYCSRCRALLTINHMPTSSMISWLFASRKFTAVNWGPVTSANNYVAHCTLEK